MKKRESNRVVALIVSLLFVVVVLLFTNLSSDVITPFVTYTIQQPGNGVVIIGFVVALFVLFFSILKSVILEKKKSTH